MRRFLILAAYATVTAALLVTGTESRSATAGTSAAARAAIGSFGVDLGAGKKTVRPGDDFFSYANGTWYDTFVIPQDRVSWGSFDELQELSQTRIRQIIEGAAAGTTTPGSPEQKVGDYYASFMDEAAVEAAGLTPVQPDLDRIRGAKSKADIASLFGSEGYF